MTDRCKIESSGTHAGLEQSERESILAIVRGVLADQREPGDMDRDRELVTRVMEAACDEIIRRVEERA